MLGEAINAFVVASAHSGISAQDVQAHCRERLAAFKMPEQVILLKSMPHNGSGKVLKQKLKEMAANRASDLDNIPSPEQGVCAASTWKFGRA